MITLNELSRDLTLGCGFYVLVLLGIGAFARRARREQSLSDHFLARRSIGFLVLLFTLFATQYSGNSLSGFPGQTYRNGLSYFMSVTFMVGIVSGFTLFAPRLFSLSRRRGYLTPTDFLHDRFASPFLGYLSAVILSVSLCNYMLAQLMAMGHAFSGLTQGQIPYWVGVLGGGLVILIYELMGGMRAVAWTDALQGTILAGGLLLVVILLMAEVGTPAQVIEQVSDVAPEKISSPPLTTCFVWISNFLLLALGAPLYPMAVQRIYAARRLSELRRALAVMAFLPLVAVTAVVFLGVVGIGLFPDLSLLEADQVTFRVLGFLVERDTRAYYPVILVMMAVVSAIMSTADSCLLSLSSIFTKDFTARLRGLTQQEAERLTGVSRLFSILIMGGLVALAFRPLTTLWGLLVIKFEILIQLSPAFVLGSLHDPEDPQAFTSRDILWGIGVGLGVALTLYATDHATLHGLHAGTLGAALNYLTVFASRRIRLRSRRTDPSLHS